MSELLQAFALAHEYLSEPNDANREAYGARFKALVALANGSDDFLQARWGEANAVLDLWSLVLRAKMAKELSVP